MRCFVLFCMGSLMLAAAGSAAERKSAVEKPESASVFLRSPRGGETWSVHSQHYILWKKEALPAESGVEIEFTANGGKSWESLAKATPNTGRYLWKIPGKLSKTCRVRISGDDEKKRAVSAAFAIIPSQEVTDYRWINVTPQAAFAPRDGAGALVFQNKMWLVGGWNSGDKTYFPRACVNDIWSSTDGSAWTQVKPNTFLDANFDAAKDWEGRHTAGYVVYKNKMWIIGGDVNQGHYHFDVWNSADGKTWNLVNQGQPIPWGPRALHHTLVFQDKIWVMGGQTIPGFAPAGEIFYRDIWNTSDGIHWNRVTPREPYWPQRGMIGGSAVFKNRMWILGGGTYDTPQIPQRKFYNDVWSSQDGARWKRHLEFAPWEPRQYHEVAVFDGRMWVMEGWNQVNRNDVWYSADGVNWYELPNTPWNPRHAASVFVYENGLWMVAGNNMESDVWKLERVTANP